MQHQTKDKGDPVLSDLVPAGAPVLIQFWLFGVPFRVALGMFGGWLFVELVHICHVKG